MELCVFRLLSWHRSHPEQLLPGLACSCSRTSSVLKAGLGPALKRLAKRRHRIHSAVFIVFFFFFGGSGGGASASARSSRSRTLLRSFSFRWRLWRDLSPFNCDIAWPHVVASNYRLQRLLKVSRFSRVAVSGDSKLRQSRERTPLLYAILRFRITNGIRVAKDGLDWQRG